MKYFNKVTPILIFLLSIFCTNNDLSAAEIIVNPGDNLQAAIDNAQGGDIIIVNGGNYGGTMNIQNRTFSAANPLIIKKGSGTPHISGTGSYSSGTTFEITNCSYIALDGFKLTSSLYGMYITLSDHIIIKNCEITDIGQEGIHARQNNQYLDILNCQIHHTGLRIDHEGWGEGIYIGGDGIIPISSNIFIAGNEIYECGLGEGINIKPKDAEKVTIKNNHVHDIHSGKTTNPNAQWNGGAIAVDQHSTNLDRLIWIEDNLIENIYNGQISNTGIMVQQTGTRVINNTINNCTDRGIWFNDYDSSHPCWNFGNSFTNNGVDVFESQNAQVYTSNPGLSPYTSQSWYVECNASELLISNSFDDINSTTIPNWDFSTSGTAVATATINQWDNAVIDITNPGINDYDIQLRQDNLAITAGQYYVLKIKARADAARSINIKLRNRPDGTIKYLEDTLEISSSAQEYAYIFEALFTDNDMRLVLLFGGDTNSVYMDYVSLEQYCGEPIGNQVDCLEYLTLNDYSISSNIFIAKINTSSTATIKQSETVIFKAGESINLNPGFSTEANTVFEAVIENCN